MSRILSLTGLGLLVACLTLAVPSAANAQGFRYGGYAPAYGYGRYAHDDCDYGYGGYGFRGYGYGRGHLHSYRRPAIVHPEFEHWTPYRGWHTHGHIHVPHRGHYHTRPY